MADPFEDEVEQTVSIQEYLQNVEEEELEVDLVLGGDEGKECTYVNGYMKRQAVFSCVTCNPDGKAGVCTACSLSCHDGHEIVELWTKRNFRCDCGNSKFGTSYCKLDANKDPENSENVYNQNFKGTYCTCGRPYPDPEAEDQVEMIQCCICEDWLHETHLGLDSLDEIPRDEEGEPLYEDFICQACAKICSFLTLYPPSIWATQENSSDKEENVKLENGAPKVETTKCILGMDLGTSLKKIDLEKTKPMFLGKNWRELLCKCETCVRFYTEKGVSFLMEKEDSIAEYEKMAKQKRQEKQQVQEGVELNFLNKLGHVQKVELLSGIADMKNELLSYLGSVDSSKPVTTADVQQVFENLARKKRQRLL